MSGTISGIDVIIPYASDGEKTDSNLGKEYNRAMNDTATLFRPTAFADHDVFVSTNPNWYQICLNAVNALEENKWGFITCLTNDIGCPHQKVDTGLRGSHDISFHKTIAAELWNGGKNGKLRQWHPKDWEEQGDIAAWPSGFFFITNKEAWEDVGGFKDGHQEVDNDYARKLVEKGYEIWQMPDLYMYHRYDRTRSW